ncbi:MAG: secondary thiamine-phosphate synthase enzyme YjbQ [Treponema sp.]|jgi:secondary thiamine-phosphate synthase enzyme|nr:secondary thiamine-phosphate synthase enzyme YjbQ [Treponema sp.]
MTSLASLTVETRHPQDWINITGDVQGIVAGSGIREGICVLFVPHTTAAVTLNENTDPAVVLDLQHALNALSPDRPEFRHREGNSAAHAKTTLLGPSLTIIVSKGKLLLGTWQGIWFTEFDGPRSRKVHVRLLGE